MPLSPLRPTDRAIYNSISQDRKMLIKKFDLNDSPGTQAGMANVRMLDSALYSPQKATTNIVGRLVAQLPEEHTLFEAIGARRIEKKEQKKLESINFPLSKLDKKLLNGKRHFLQQLSENPGLIHDSIQNINDELEWPNNVANTVVEVLGIEHWPAHPESWRRILFFIESDEILQGCFYNQAKRYYPKSPNQCNELVSQIRHETYLSALNSADNRAGSDAPDLGAEMLKYALYTIASRLVERETHFVPRKFVTMTSVPNDIIDTIHVQHASDAIEVRDLLDRLPPLNRIVIENRMNGMTDQENADCLRLYGNDLASIVAAMEACDNDLDGIGANMPNENCTSFLEELRREAEICKNMDAKKIRKIRLHSGRILGYEDPKKKKSE